MQSLHAFIICWPGKEADARHIAREIRPHADFLTVIYSTKDGSARDGDGTWVQVPDTWYYGRKFREILDRNLGELLLQIHADASASDWSGILRRCRDVHAGDPAIAIWAPDVDHTHWDTPSVEISRTADGQLACVAQTDCIVWSMNGEVVKRMADLDYSVNSFGWGVDWAAIAFAFVNNRLVVRDLTVRVAHAQRTGYGREDAYWQMVAFVEQLTPQERVAQKLLETYVEQKRALAVGQTGADLAVANDVGPTELAQGA